MTWLQTRRTATLSLLTASRATLSPALSRLGVGLCGSALLGLTAAATVAAAPDKEPGKEPNWYQIELVVFTQPQQPLQAEYWQEQLLPTFTPNAIRLRPSAGFESPERGKLSADSRLATNSGLARELAPPRRQEYRDGAFTLLNKRQLSQPLEAKEPIPPIDIRQLERQGHRILFEGQWRQPVHEKNQARSIVIRGGERLAPDYFELEGDIRLSLSRYIHLRPNLYLTLPLPPEWQPRHPGAIEALPSASVNTPLKPGAIQALASASVNTQPKPDTATTTPPAATRPLSIEPLQALQPPVPEPRYLRVPLDQSRRMSRNELHYLDHPLFGMLIRFTAYTPGPEVTEAAIQTRNPNS
ncbi:MAG: hypothetical protein ACI9W6_000961 [Motiliproteus sp.]|jgi:hypothetical protein